jgi:hypothetical protein
MPTMGFDIEFFVSDNASRKIMPVCGRVGGNKKQHVMVANSREGGVPWEIHEDNVALEVNSPVFDDVLKVERWLRNLPSDLSFDMKTAGFKVHPIAVSYQNQITFPKKMLQAAGPQALEIGCDPDFSAYYKNGAIPRQINTGHFEKGERFVGAHVHIGYATHEHIPHHCVARLMDMVALQYPESLQEGRLATYGLGTYRPKPYGIEYRALSTTGLFNNLNIISAFWNLAVQLETNPQGLAEIYGVLDEADWSTLREYHKKNEAHKKTVTHKSGMPLMEEGIFVAPEGFASKRLRPNVWDQYEIFPEQ